MSAEFLFVFIGYGYIKQVFALKIGFFLKYNNIAVTRDKQYPSSGAVPLLSVLRTPHIRRPVGYICQVLKIIYVSSDPPCR